MWCCPWIASWACDRGRQRHVPQPLHFAVAARAQLRRRPVEFNRTRSRTTCTHVGNTCHLPDVLEGQQSRAFCVASIDLHHPAPTRQSQTPVQAATRFAVCSCRPTLRRVAAEVSCAGCEYLRLADDQISPLMHQRSRLLPHANLSVDLLSRCTDQGAEILL